MSVPSRKVDSFIQTLSFAWFNHQARWFIINRFDLTTIKHTCGFTNDLPSKMLEFRSKLQELTVKKLWTSWNCVCPEIEHSHTQSGHLQMPQKHGDIVGNGSDTQATTSHRLVHSNPLNLLTLEMVPSGKGFQFAMENHHLYVFFPR
jgi:hypothetical protein